MESTPSPTSRTLFSEELNISAIRGFLESDAFGKIVRNGAEILADSNVITRKTEDKAMNFAYLLRELQHGNSSNALNYAGSMLSNDFAEGNHFRNEGRRRFLD